MSSTYRFHQPAPRPTLGPLPDGDYNFIVAACDRPGIKASGNLVLAVKLSIQPEGIPVFANPWARTDQSLTQDGRDDIAVFLLCINRAPRDGEEPDWDSLVGARGKCHLKQEEAKMGALAGKMVNKVAWFHVPKQIGPQAQAPQNVSKSQFDQARQQAAKNAGLEHEPTDIPF
jgi:hypothetical protein